MEVLKVRLSNNISCLDAGLSHGAATAAVLVRLCSLWQTVCFTQPQGARQE